MKHRGNTEMTREDILRVAGELIDGQRAEEYGPALEQHGRIAELWSSYLGKEITAVDVAMLMILLKVSRSKTSESNDSYIDICGYAALACEMGHDLRS